MFETRQLISHGQKSPAAPVLSAGFPAHHSLHFYWCSRSGKRWSTSTASWSGKKIHCWSLIEEGSFLCMITLCSFSSCYRKELLDIGLLVGQDQEDAARFTFGMKCWHLNVLTVITKKGDNCFCVGSLFSFSFLLFSPLFLLINQISRHKKRANMMKTAIFTGALEQRKFKTSFSRTAMLCLWVENNILYVVVLIKCAIIQ